MAAINSYFKIVQSEQGTSIQIIPPVENGERIKMDELKSYLEMIGVDMYDLKKLNEVVTTCTQAELVVLNHKEIYTVNEYMNIAISPDRMYAIVRFYPASNMGSRLTEDDIISELKARGVVYGIDEEAIRRHIENPHYCMSMIFAKGTQPRHGSDAFITYHFQTDRKAKPTLNEDGTVDFHKLDNINHVNVGDILATLTKEDPGDPGTDINGNKVLPRKVARMILRHGKNIKLSEDGCTMTSEVDGHVSLEGDRVFVSNVYSVPADVDASTGDIEYNGNISVNGNIRTGFKVVAEGNIEVRGVVEGAVLEAGGDIIMHRGVQGMGKAILKAKGNIISKFIESANVSADGYIETNTILHSKVEAVGDISVRGKNGSIIGGHVRATNLIEASIIGSHMETITTVEVGCDPKLQDRINECKKLIMEKESEKQRLSQAVALLKKKQAAGTLPPDKLKSLMGAVNAVVVIDNELKKLTEEYEDCATKLDDNKNALIKVTKDIFPGSKVVISSDYILVHDSVSHCKYMKIKGEIKPIPIY